MSYREAMMASLGAQTWGTDEIDSELVSLFPEFPVMSLFAPSDKAGGRKPPRFVVSSKSKNTELVIKTPPKVLEQKSTNIGFNCGLGKAARKKARRKAKKNFSVPLDVIEEIDETMSCLSFHADSFSTSFCLSQAAH